MIWELKYRHGTGNIYNSKHLNFNLVNSLRHQRNQKGVKIKSDCHSCAFDK